MRTTQLPLRAPRVIIALPMMFFWVMGCANDSTNDLILPPNAPLSQPTYTNNVAAVINNNCIGCHAATPINNAPMPLVTYEQVKQAVQERGLLDRISRPQGAEGMMPNGGTRLPQSTIDMMVQWRDQGLQR